MQAEGGILAKSSFFTGGAQKSPFDRRARRYIACIAQNRLDRNDRKGGADCHFHRQFCQYHKIRNNQKATTSADKSRDRTNNKPFSHSQK